MSQMSVDLIVWAVVFLTGLSGAYSLVDYKSCPERKKLLRLFGCVIFFYLTGVYTAIIINPNDPFLRSGTLSRVGIIVLSVFYLLEIWVDRQGDRAK
jgi:hypothetical protein